jgi:hypothetical protein
MLIPPNAAAHPDRSQTFSRDRGERARWLLRLWFRADLGPAIRDGVQVVFE